MKRNHHLFPVRDHHIYLNHAGVSPLPQPAVEAMRRFAEESSQLGSEAFKVWLPQIAETRRLASQLLGAGSPAEVGFVKSTTQGLQMLSWGIGWRPGDVIILEETPFPSNWYPWLWARKCGAEFWLWPERNFRFELDELDARLREGNVRMVAICSAHFGTGFRHDLAAIGKLCREHGALFVVDGIQTVGAFPIDVRACQIDFLCADGHKWMMGPESAGVIYARPEALREVGDHVVGWIGRQGFTDFGRLDQEAEQSARRFEEGAPNYVGNVTLGATLRMLLDEGIENVARQIRENCSALEDGIRGLGWELVSPVDDSASGIVASRTSHGADMEPAAAHLRANGVVCNVRRGFLRFAPHYYQDVEEMQRVIRLLGEMG